MYMYINSQLTTLRGTILEESIPSGAKTDTSKGIPPRDVVEYICQGELSTSCLKLAKSDKKVQIHVIMYTKLTVHAVLSPGKKLKSGAMPNIEAYLWSY